jgi:hypothetical protein
MRNRMIKKEFWNAHRILSISPNERLMFICMFNVADDDGILKNSALQMKSICYSCDSDITLGMVEEYIKNLLGVGLIELNDERTLIRIVNWKNHQRIDKPTPSRHKFKRVILENYGNDTRVLPEDYTPKERKGKERKTKEKKETVQDKSLELFTEFYELYKRKQDRKRAERAFKNLTRKNQLLCIEGVKKYNKWIELNSIERNMIKLPTTYINGEHWDDILETEIKDKPAKVEYKLDATGNAVLGYCDKCGQSDFYDPYKVQNTDSYCCNAALLPEKKANGALSLADITEKYQ